VRPQTITAQRIPLVCNSIITEVRLAASFLTIIPVGGSASTTDVTGSFGWFPLIGFILGALLAGADDLLALFLSGPVRSTLLVIALTIITGAVHLDGLADTADALGAGGDRARALEILRDSRIGTFGAAAVVLVMALKIVALASAADTRRSALYLGPGIARWAMVALPYELDYLREQGAGSALLGVQGRRNVRLASIITIIALLPVAAARAMRGIITAIIITWILRLFYSRWLGGITGDLIGAAGEVIEAVVLVTVSS
jgi:adenosylcobinamide-GDP ribazoletransferase